MIADLALAETLPDPAPRRFRVVTRPHGWAVLDTCYRVFTTLEYSNRAEAEAACNTANDWHDYCASPEHQPSLAQALLGYQP